MRRASLGIGVLCLLAACNQANGDRTNSSESAHTEGELLWDNHPYNWTTVAMADIDAAMQQKSVPPGNVIVKRLQAWVDRFDVEVRKVVQQKTGQALVAPSPKLRLIIDAEPNAFIMPIPTCLASASSPSSSNQKLAVFMTPSDYDGSGRYSCLDGGGWPGKASGGVDWFNTLGGLQLTAQASAIGVSDGTRYDQVAVISAAGFVNVQLGIVAMLSEKSVASAMAHELGHYYRAHNGTVSRDKYDFWYDRDDQLPVRPTPVPDQQQYYNEYQRLRVPRFMIPLEVIHPRVSSTLIQWATQMQVTSGHVCEPVVAEVASWASGTKNELLADSGPDLSGVARRAYLSLEKQGAACLAALQFSDDASATAAPFSTNTVPRSWFASRIKQPLRAEVTDAEIGATKSLAELVALLTTKAKTVDAEQPAFLQRLIDDKIGLYTIEQEADDIGFEIATRVGMTAQDVYKGMIELSRAVEKIAQPSDFDQFNDNMTTAQCEALLATGFKDPTTGKLIHVPIGSLDDPHHAQCYRLFNLYRENLAHQYVPGPQNFPAPTPAWTDIQKQAIDILKGGPVDGGSSGNGNTGKPGNPGKTGPGTDSPTDPPDTSGDDSSDDPGSPSGGTAAVPGVTKHTTTSSCNAAPMTTGNGFGVGLGLALAMLARRRSKGQPTQG